MAEEKKISQIEYNGEILNLNQIAKIEGLNKDTLKKYYDKASQDIYIAVQQAKEAQVREQARVTRIEYNGEMLSLYQIAKNEGLVRDVLKKYYNNASQDIYIAVQQAKEAQARKKEKISQIEYNGEILNLNQIAKNENISYRTLSKYFEETKNIYEAVQQAKEAQARRKEMISQIEYNGEILNLNQIAKIEGLEANTLTKYYNKGAQDIYQAVQQAKEAQTRRKEMISQIEYNGEILTINKIAKIEGLSDTTLIKYYNKGAQDIYIAVQQAKEAQAKEQTRVTRIEYNGEILNLNQIAKIEGVNVKTLTKYYNKGAQDIYIAVQQAKEAQAREQARITRIEYNGEMLSLYQIAKNEGISPDTIKKYYKETNNNIYQAVQQAKEAQAREQARITRIEYNGKILNLNQIAKIEGLNNDTLKRYYNKTSQDIYKSVMLCKFIQTRRERKRQVVSTKQFGNLTYYDISVILGIKYSALNKLLEEGNSIDDIIETTEKNNIRRQNPTGKRIVLENGQTLIDYCLENKLNYNCIYRSMRIYGKSLEEAVNNYNKNGQSTPTTWIFEKYGALLRHVMINESVDIDRVVSYMRKDYLPLEQAIEKYIIRNNSEKENLDKDWMEELYDVLSDDSINKEEYDDYLKAFYVDEKEENCIKKSKSQSNKIKRKFILFDIAESLEKGWFTPEEERDLLETYDVTENEVDIIFKDLYKRFTAPGVLLGKEQPEDITPEQIEERDEKISKYKNMVKDIRQDKSIIFVMRFMVGPNVETNEEYRKEIQREIEKQKEEKCKNI